MWGVSLIEKLSRAQEAGVDVKWPQPGLLAELLSAREQACNCILRIPDHQIWKGGLLGPWAERV